MPLSDKRVQSLINNNIWNDDCPVHYSELSCIEIPFINFDGFSQIGEIMIADVLVENVKTIFSELYDAKFPIASLKLMDVFKGDDLASMEANNSSGYNGRKIMNTSRWSSHAYGVAIDINPAQNPYLSLDVDQANIQVFPSSGITYVNRIVQKPGMVDDIVSIFSDNGFTEWGGNWELKPDYHHFQLPWDEIEKLFPGN